MKYRSGEVRSKLLVLLALETISMAATPYGVRRSPVRLGFWRSEMAVVRKSPYFRFAGDTTRMETGPFSE
jgi:hypothetical protein